MSYPNTPGYKTLGPSKEAAQVIRPHAKASRKKIVSWLLSRYPAGFTADEIADHFHTGLIQVRPRLAEAHYAREVEQTGERRRSKAGLMVNCWRAVREQ